MHRVVVNAAAAASGAKDGDRCDVCAKRKWQFLVLFKKFVTFV